MDVHLKVVLVNCAIIYSIIIGYVVYRWVTSTPIDEDIEELDK